METPQALLSVSDKRELVPFARGLVGLGYRILATGGTLQELQRHEIPVTQVSEYTQSPEILGGRVKTLHPRIHGGLLGRPDRSDDAAEMKAQNINPIQIVAVNLYPFRDVSERGGPTEEVIENIDIGGPSMIRSAAKNYQHVSVLVDPSDYAVILTELQTHGTVAIETRQRLMRKAFAHTAAYDASISQWLTSWAPADEAFSQEWAAPFLKVQNLRYGENPHQRAAFYRSYGKPKGPTVAHAQLLQGKELSYNNLADLDAALSAVLEFPESPAAVIVKHNTPCGVARSESLETAYRNARAVDEVSAFGGVVALNREIDGATARALAETFLEAVIAPSVSVDARVVFEAKKNLRVLSVGTSWEPTQSVAVSQMDMRSVSGGLLVMDRDAAEPKTEWKVVTKRAPTDSEWESLRFAWRACKHVKSNAIVFSDAHQTLGIGGGQTSRVDSVKSAVSRAGDKLKGSAVASDAFFPFRDGLDEAARAGATCVVQPGGSVRDNEIIAAADEQKLAMVFTGVRHFRH